MFLYLVISDPSSGAHSWLLRNVSRGPFSRNVISQPQSDLPIIASKHHGRMDKAASIKWDLKWIEVLLLPWVSVTVGAINGSINGGLIAARHITKIDFIMGQQLSQQHDHHLLEDKRSSRFVSAHDLQIWPNPLCLGRLLTKWHFSFVLVSLLN